MEKQQTFKRLFSSNELKLDGLTPEDIKKLGLSSPYEFKGSKYYVFFGTSSMLNYINQYIVVVA